MLGHKIRKINFMMMLNVSGKLGVTQFFDTTSHLYEDN